MFAITMQLGIVSSRVRMNRKDWETFRAFWNGAFNAVREVIGYTLNSREFDKLLGVLADKEAAQALVAR